MNIRWKLCLKVGDQDGNDEIYFPANGFGEYESVVELLFAFAAVAVKTHNGDQLVMYSYDGDTKNLFVVPDTVYWQFFFTNNQPLFTSTVDPLFQPGVTAIHHWYPQDLVDVYNAFVRPGIAEMET